MRDIKLTPLEEYVGFVPSTEPQYTSFKECWEADLKRIWDKRYAIVFEDIKSYILGRGIEKKFIIKNVQNDLSDKYKLASILGITGYYSYHGDIGISWHGIFPQYQKLGWSKEALRQLEATVLVDPNYASAKRIVELIPPDREDELGHYFKKRGFKRSDERVTVDPTWTDAIDWASWIIYEKQIER